MSRARASSLGAIPAGTSIISRPPLNTQTGPSLSQTEVIAPQNEAAAPTVPYIEQLVSESWQQKSLLAFDGGGIRGYASLLIVAELMKYIGRAEREHAEPHVSSFGPFKRPPELKTRNSSLAVDEGSYLCDFLPCHYFDYIIGTSTGGLIAIMLSRWRMSVADCLRQYEVVGGKVFGEPRKVSILGWPHNKHHKAPLVEAIQDIVAQRVPNEGESSEEKFQMFPAPADLCRVAVVAIQKGKNRTEGGAITQDGTYLFRSYKPDNIDPLWPPLNYGVSNNHEIWKVCRATSAAPFYFKSQVIGDEEYCDGGVGANNPTQIAIDEVNQLHGNRLRIVASFGTGKPVKESMFRRGGHQLHLGRAIDHGHRLFKTATAALTDCEITHEQVLNRSRASKRTDAPFDYFRFNIEEGLGKVKFNEWKSRRDDGGGGQCTTIVYLRKCAERELAKSEVQANLRALAIQLVEKRRDRARCHTAHWERFACCTSYRCLDDRCLHEAEGLGRSFTTRDEIRQHLITVHPTPSQQQLPIESLESKLDKSRQMPEFPAGPF